MVDGLTLRDRCAALQAAVATLLFDTPPDTFRQLVDEMAAIASDMTTKKAALQLQEARIDAKLEMLAELTANKTISQEPIKTAVREEDGALRKIVTLNVGGTLFTTARETLLRVPGSYFDTMLSSDHWRPNEKGEYFLDVDPSTFARVIKYFRSGVLDMSKLSATDKTELWEMFDYLQIKWPVLVPTSIEAPRLHWDSSHCSADISLDENNMRATSSKISWANVLASMPVTSFAVRVQLGAYVEVGFMPRHHFAPKASECGWYFHCETGTVRSRNVRLKEPSISLETKSRSVFLQVTWHRDQERISFAVDGVPLSIGLQDVPTVLPLYPFARFASRDTSVKILPV
ncbi:hypothetical protein SPRG_12859 [Saprolegnia parasitica CBS 223.65]|uniref:BTB domain-containing protein n=1 Tax=Saprolegnia parasitica (strain CBS 223.65) TaxID=695850 RepID=A0A067BXQ1_SAPPC|nr:hypothetical protein SPRG_12859 [Saprolegnia parasitica CBS 223.65]KDO21620.1 hypothetical protein SPRG_12859 [Saprolegnia parasitica CBS 223.65]|eukprot:XP_012207634.1 hypothetical protein SPRG_12859 [Saprolegnia parasitica CBS 223.65]